MHLQWMKILSKSVIKVFVELHKKKLIYKAEKLVNWDTVLKTAISDLEVDQREMNSKIYYIRYPIDKSTEFYYYCNYKTRNYAW